MPHRLLLRDQHPGPRPQSRHPPGRLRQIQDPPRRAAFFGQITLAHQHVGHKPAIPALPRPLQRPVRPEQRITQPPQILAQPAQELRVPRAHPHQLLTIAAPRGAKPGAKEPHMPHHQRQPDPRRRTCSPPAHAQPAHPTDSDNLRIARRAASQRQQIPVAAVPASALQARRRPSVIRPARRRQRPGSSYRACATACSARPAPQPAPRRNPGAAHPRSAAPRHTGPRSHGRRAGARSRHWPPCSGCSRLRPQAAPGSAPPPVG